MSTEQANRRLLKILEEAVNKHTDWRFGQILYNYGFIENIGVDSIEIKDPFFDNSEKILERVNTEIKRCKL